MKNNIYMLVALATLAFSSCSDDYLNTEPQESANTSTILATTENAQLAINGLAKAMTQQYLSTQGMNGEGTIKNWYGNYPGMDTQKCNLTGWSNTINGKYHENATSQYVYYPWFYYYKLIGNANAIISEIDNAKGEQYERDFIKAQALTYRAYSYMMLVQLYSYRWMDKQGECRGLPLRIEYSMKNLESATADVPASTEKEVYAQIYKDLDDAISLYTSAKSQGKMDRASGDFWSPNINVAYATYARAALNREDWANAAKYATLARDGYPLMSDKDYLNGGFNTANQEWIWGCYGASDETLFYYSYFAYIGSNSSASNVRSYPFAISKELINQIPETDERRGLYLVPTEAEVKTYTTSTGRASKGTLYNRAKADYAEKLYGTSYVFAYMQFKITVADQPGVGQLNNFRSAEMYYTEAEALCHLGGHDSDVQKILEKINQTYNPDYTCEKTGDELLEEVKLYRRFDLWGEGFDWFDHKRWGDTLVRKSHPDGNFHSTFAITVPPTGDDSMNAWTWVYPAKEVDYNKLIDNYKE